MVVYVGFNFKPGVLPKILNYRSLEDLRYLNQPVGQAIACRLPNTCWLVPVTIHFCCCLRHNLEMAFHLMEIGSLEQVVGGC